MNYDFWDGTTSYGEPGATIAFDTETEVVYQKDEHGQPVYKPGKRIKDKTTLKLVRNPDGTPATTPPTLASKPLTDYSPRLAILTAYDGVRPPVVVRHHQLADFILTHPRRQWVGHNVAFDFWSVHDELVTGRDIFPECELALHAWTAGMAVGTFHDTMLLHKLVLLAKGEKFYGLNLAKLARAYDIPGEPDKDDPFRLRFGELIGLDDEAFRAADPGFFRYATADVVATLQIWQKLLPEATALHESLAASRTYPDALARWGPLTETIQVQGAAALLKVSRHGLALNATQAAALEASLREEHARALTFFEEGYPDLLQRYAEKGKHQGAVKLAPKSGLPQMKTGLLREILTDLARCKGFEPPYSAGKLAARALRQGKAPPVSASVKAWKDYAGVDKFVGHWLGLAPLGKLLGFFAELKKRSAGDGRIHASYNPLLKTGRTGCEGPNLQQIPRDARFRELFTASPGHVLLTADYKFIELRTLAACCELWLGKSRLGEVIRAGVDPHEFTAALMNGLTLEAFQALKQTDPAKYKKDRQSAKAINFGYPGGLGADTFVAYAKAQYGVTLTKENAAAFKGKLTSEIYPELNDSHGYLADPALADLARNLGLERGPLLEFLLPRLKSVRFDLYRLGQVLKGDPVYPSGDAYPHADVKKLWTVLDDVLALPEVRVSEEIRAQVKARATSYKALYRPLFRSIAVTPTGRVRAGVAYTEGKNSPFQGLAADGAKLALWKLIAAGYRVVAFVHDEIVTELPEATAKDQAEQVAQVLCRSMEEVLGGVPAGVDYGIDFSWKKI
jgi:hypothetical protein